MSTTLFFRRRAGLRALLLVAGLVLLTLGAPPARAATEYTGEVQVDRLAWCWPSGTTNTAANCMGQDYPPLPASDGYLYGRKNLTSSSVNVLYRLLATGGTPEAVGSNSPANSLGLGAYAESNGELYGIRGNSSADTGNGLSLIFKLDSDYSASNVASSIASYSTSGGLRTCLAPLLPDGSGNLYGICQYDYTAGTTNGGPVVFKIDADGNYSVVADLPIWTYYTTLANCLAGTVSTASTVAFGTPIRMILSGDYLYLLKTYSTNNCDSGALSWTTSVALHKIAVDGSGSTVIHEFDNSAVLPAATMAAGMVVGADGMIYGTAGGLVTDSTTTAVQGNYTTTIDGSASDDPGFIWRISTDGEDYEVVHTFDWDSGTGAGPYGPLALGGDGRIYGVTRAGGGNTRDDDYICPTDYDDSYVCDRDASTDGVLWSLDPTLIDSDDTAYTMEHAFSRYTTGKDVVGLNVSADGSVIYGSADRGGTFQEISYTLYWKEDGTWYYSTGTKNAYYDQGTIFAVTLVQADAPSIDSFAASPEAVTQGESFTLSWSASNASSCTASGDWDGSRDVSGSETLSPTDVTSYDYTLTCSGTEGTTDAVKTVSVRVNAPTNAVVSSASYGNGGALGAGLLAGLAGFAGLARHCRRRRAATA
ncbi:MAG: hypothetical protein QM661_12725 [Solimonas sp.]